MVQVFVNLLDNAMRHTQPGQKIEVRVAIQEEKLKISVLDEGEGIDEKLLPDLFDEFVTSSRGKSDQQRGIGLGLAICKAVFEAHGGTIQASNRETGGAQFDVMLPRDRGGKE